MSTTLPALKVTTAEYDASGPPPGFGKTFLETGDLAALQAAADWYRDRGQPTGPDAAFHQPSDEASACAIDVYRHYQELWHAQARLVRASLKMIKFLDLPFAASWRLSDSAVQSLLSCHQLPVALLRIIRRRVQIGGRQVTEYLIEIPTDHIDEDRTRVQLLKILSARFPRGRFTVRFESEWNGIGTEAGEHALFKESYTD